jgi:hypothetical protein
MSEIAYLGISTFVDNSNLDAGFGEAAQKAESFDKGLSSQSMQGPSISPGKHDGVSSMVPQMGQIGLSLKSAFTGAMAPLVAFGSRFTTMFDEVGGTITRLATRLDTMVRADRIEADLKREATAFKVVGVVGALAAVKVGLAFSNPAIYLGATVLGGAFMAVFPKVADYANRAAGKISTFFLMSGSVMKKTLTQLEHLKFPNPFRLIGSQAKQATTAINGVKNAAVGGTKSLGNQVLTTLGIFSAPAAIVGFFGAGIKGASDLRETMSKVDTVFNDSSDLVKANADKMAAAYGLPKKSILDASAAIGLIGKGAGQSDKAAAQLGTNMSNLAADAASFYNVPLDEALGKIRSGLVGQSEPLLAFGIQMNEAKVEAEAMRLGFGKVGKTLSDEAKTAARASLITKGLADASGDLARTSGSTANQFKKLTGGVGNLATTVGSSMLPAVDVVLGGFNAMVSGIGTFAERNKASFEAVGEYVKSAFANFGEGVSNVKAWLGTLPEVFTSVFGDKSQMISDLGASIMSVADGIGMVWRNLPAFAEIALIKIREKFLNLGEMIHWTIDNAGALGSYFANNFSKLVTDGLTFVGTGFKNLALNIWNLGKAVVEFIKDPTQGFQFNWKGLTEGFVATAEQLPELIKPALTSLQAEIDAKTLEIGTKEAERAKAIAAKAKLDASITPAKRPIAGGPAEAAKEAGQLKLAGASELGSKEAYSSIVSATRSTPGGNAQQRAQADNLAELRKQTGLLGGLAGAIGNAVAQAGQPKVVHAL